MAVWTRRAVLQRLDGPSDEGRRRPYILFRRWRARRLPGSRSRSFSFSLSRFSFARSFPALWRCRPPRVEDHRDSASTERGTSEERCSKAPPQRAPLQRTPLQRTACRPPPGAAAACRPPLAAAAGSWCCPASDCLASANAANAANAFFFLAECFATTGQSPGTVRCGAVRYGTVRCNRYRGPRVTSPVKRLCARCATALKRRGGARLSWLIVAETPYSATATAATAATLGTRKRLLD